jgi:Alkylmercury lyase
MTPQDLAVRNATYRLMAEHGRAPSADDVASATRQGTGDGAEAVREAWRRLHDGHALVLVDRGAPEPALRMLNPFSVVETPHVVEAAGRRWFANCAWDAFGIGVALRTDSRIHTTCMDCGEAIDLDVRDYRPTDPAPVFHCLVPARDWWSDIGFT